MWKAEAVRECNFQKSWHSIPEMAQWAREQRARRGGEDCLYRILSHKFISHRWIISFSFELALHVIHAARVWVAVSVIVFRTRYNLIFVSFHRRRKRQISRLSHLAARNGLLFIYQSNDYGRVFVLDASQFLSVSLYLSFCFTRAFADPIGAVMSRILEPKYFHHLHLASAIVASSRMRYMRSVKPVR